MMMYRVAYAIAEGIRIHLLNETILIDQDGVKTLLMLEK